MDETMPLWDNGNVDFKKKTANNNKTPAMKLNPVSTLRIPGNLKIILEDEEYWEDDSFDPLLITIQPVVYQGKNVISFQAEFEPPDDSDDIDGDEWEEIIRDYIREKDPGLETRIHGDSESSTCVLWTDNEADFRKMLGFMIEVLEQELG